MKDINKFINYSKENGNIIITCKDCSDQKLLNFLNKNGIEELLIAYETSKVLYIKSKFVQDDKVEYMWVKVTSFIEKDNECFIQGILDNDPALISDVKCGDIVNVKLENIYNFIADNKNFMPLV